MFQPRDTSRYFEQEEQQGSFLDSLLPILLSIIGKAKGKRSETGSMVQTYLDISRGGAGVVPTPVAAAVPVPKPALPPLVQSPVVEQLTRILQRPKTKNGET
jgi:hypothetical protein